MRIFSKNLNRVKSNKSIFDFNVEDLDSNIISLENYKNFNPIIIVNVASK